MNDVAVQDNRSHAWIGVLATVLAFLVVAKIPFFSPDSWSYLELSNTVYSDFYRANTVRQYVVDSEYSCAFPPVWPVLIATVRKVLDIGIYAGVVINFVVSLVLLAALIRLARRLDLPRWVGTAVYLGIVACTAFLDDALAARNYALSLLFFTMAVEILVRPTVTVGGAALAGFWMGLACMNRFDAMPTAALAGLIVVIRASRLGLTQAMFSGAAYAATFVLMLLPWIAFSKLHFGTWWASDNARQVFLARDAFVMNYYAVPPGSELLANPLGWFKGLLTSKIPMSWKGLVFTLIHSATLPLLGAILVVRAGRGNPPIGSPRRRFLVIGGLLAASFVIAPTLVGYGDERYFLPIQWFLLIALFAKLVAMTPGVWSRGRVIALLGVMALAIVPAAGVPWAITNRAKLRNADWFAALRKPTPEMERVANAIEKDAAGKWNRLLVYSPYGDGRTHATFFMPDGSSFETVTYTESPGAWNEWQYGALTQRNVAVMPIIKTGTYATFFRDWRITHIYDGLHIKASEFRKDAIFDDEQTTVRLVPLDVPGLYRIELRPKEK